MIVGDNMVCKEWIGEGDQANGVDINRKVNTSWFLFSQYRLPWYNVNEKNQHSETHL